MTDNEIIKALEVCANNGDCEECAINPHHGNYGYCTSLAIKAALDLIKRQQEKIEMLKAQNGVYETCIDHKQKSIECLEIELKAVRGIANSYKLHYDNLKMEIACEVCDRLKAKGNKRNWIIGIMPEEIDSLIEEMESENESH